MRKAHIVALVAQFWAFILSFIILLAGKNKQMTSLYFAKVRFCLSFDHSNELNSLQFNTTNLGRDALRDSTLFAMNNSNILYSIATTHNKMLTAPFDVSATSLTPNSADEGVPSMRRGLDTRQAPPAPATPAKPNANVVVLILDNAIDMVAEWLGVQPSGGIPITLKKMATVSVADVQDGLGEFYLKTRSKVTADISTVMSNYLTEIAAGYKASAASSLGGAASLLGGAASLLGGAAPLGGTASLLGGAAPKAAPTIKGRAVRQLSTYTDFSMTSEEADNVMEALLKEVKHPAFAAKLAKEMPQVITNLNISTAEDAMFTSQKSVNDAGLDKPFFSSSPIAPLQGTFITAGPAMLRGLKTTVVRGMNAGMKNVKKAVPIYDWYKFYLGHMCWGTYKEDPKSGKISEELVGCGTTARWKDINLAPIAQKMLHKSGIKAQAPPQIGVGSGLEKSFEGLRKFTGLIHSFGVLTIVNATFALILTLLAIGATGFVNAEILKTIYFATGTVCGGTMLLVYSNAIIITVSLGGVAYIMPGAGETFGAIVNVGGGFLVLLWINVALTFAGVMAWLVMWFSLVREGEFERGKVEGASMVTMVNGYETPQQKEWF